MKVFELYSGIGGMHTALRMSQRSGDVVCAIDINQTANAVYAHNYPSTYLINGNIQGLTTKKINKLQIDTILMSPPCQPFTRNGLQKDIQDPRTNSFAYLLSILPELNISQLLLENVKGFEQSEMHDMFLKTLTECGFNYHEFLLTPWQFGIPNSRFRYYCIAKKVPFDVNLLSTIPHNGMDVHSASSSLFALDTILEEAVNENYNVPIRELLKRCQLLDIVYKDSKRSCCFTKSYGRYIEGTGSVFTLKHKSQVDDVYRNLSMVDEKEGDLNSKLETKEKLLKSLQFRFFTPREVCRLMCFPEEFTFPEHVSDKQKYMLLGNSINCKVVSELIKIL